MTYKAKLYRFSPLLSKKQQDRKENRSYLKCIEIMLSVNQALTSQHLIMNNI